MPLHVEQHGELPMADLHAAIEKVEKKGETVVQVMNYANAWYVVTAPAPAVIVKADVKRPAKKTTRATKGASS